MRFGVNVLSVAITTVYMRRHGFRCAGWRLNRYYTTSSRTTRTCGATALCYGRCSITRGFIETNEKLSEILLQIPYGDIVENTKVMNVVKKGCLLSRPNACPDDVYVLMRGCWHMVGCLILITSKSTTLPSQEPRKRTRIGEIVTQLQQLIAEL